jgi:hypothetical protein
VRRDAVPVLFPGASLLPLALLSLAACGPANAPPPPPQTVVGWWVGPTLATTWHAKKTWDARDPRATPTYCSLEFEFFSDGTVETNWLNEASWASMCSFAHLPFATDPSDPSLIRIGPPGAVVRSCRFLHEGNALKAACANEPNPPADARGAVALRPREPEMRVGIDGMIGTWQSGAFGDDVFSLTVRSDARFAIQKADGAPVDSGWASATDTALELHGGHDVKCAYRATSRKLTMRCPDAASRAGTTVVYTRMR